MSRRRTFTAILKWAPSSDCLRRDRIRSVRTVSTSEGGDVAESQRVRVARDAYLAYVTGDRSAVEAVLADDFVFYSPPDPGIDRATYFERCWPNSEHIESFDFKNLVEFGDQVLVTYVGTRT